MYEEFCVAACRFFIRQVCVSDIRGLIVTPFNSELIYLHLDVPLLSVRRNGPRGNLGDRLALRQSCSCRRARSHLPNSGLPSAAQRGSRNGRREWISDSNRYASNESIERMHLGVPAPSVRVRQRASKRTPKRTGGIEPPHPR